MTEPEKVKLNGDPCDYAWAACTFCRNTMKFCGSDYTVCPCCGAEYEVLPDGESAIPVALPGLYEEEQ